MFRNTNNIFNDRGRLYSTPYDKSKSFLSRMKNAVQNYTPTWMQTFVNSEHVPREEIKSLQNYGDRYGDPHLGIKHQNYDGRRIENHHSLYNTDNTQTASFFDERNDSFLTKNKVVGSQSIYDKNDEDYVHEKQKRRRSDNCIETIPEVTSRPPLKRIALHKDDDLDRASTDSPITPQKNYFVQNKKLAHQNHKSTFDKKSYNSIPSLHKSSATSIPVQKPATRIFMSNRNRTFVSKSSSQPTTPLFSKREDPGHDVLMSPFYNRPIMFGGAMAYQGTMKKRQESKGGRLDMTNTSQRISHTLNKLEESQRSETNNTITFPPLIYDSSLYKRMTLAPRSKNQGPPTKERLTPSLPAYNNTPIQTNIGGKMRREREKRHEMRRKDDGDENDAQRQPDAQLASIKLPPITFQASSLFPNPPSTTIAKPSRGIIGDSSKASLSFNTSKSSVRKFHFQEPIHLSSSQGRLKVHHNNNESFSFKSPLRHTCKHKKTPSSSFKSSPHPSILHAAPVNFTSAKKKSLNGSKKVNGELKQGSVMDILGKSPLTTTSSTPATSSSNAPASSTPLSVLFASKIPKWICPTCMVENKDDVAKCPCCETNKPIATVTTQSLFSKHSAPITQPSVPSPSTLVKTSQEKVIPLTELFKTASSKGWECPVCMVANKEGDLKCPCCNEPKPLPKPSLPSSATASKPIAPPSTSTFSSIVPVPTPSQPPSTILSQAPPTITATTTEESKVLLNSSGGFKFAISNSSTPVPSPFTITTSTTATKASEAAPLGGFKPSSSTILSSNLPTNPIFSAPSSFGGFKFGATANQSLSTTSAPSFGSSFTMSKSVSTAPPPTQTTSSASLPTTTASTFPVSAPFAFGMNKSTPSTTSLGFGSSKPLFGSSIQTSLPTTTASFFGATASANSSGFFASNTAPTSTSSKPLFQFGSSNALASVATTTSTPSLPMFSNPPATTTSSFDQPNQLFGSTSNSLFSNNKTTSSFFPISNQFPSFSTTTSTTASTTQNSFQLTTTNPISSSSLFPTTQTGSLFNKQENNNNNNNNLFNNSAFSSFNSPATLASTTANSLFPSNLSNSNIFKFGAPQTTSTTGMFGLTTTTTSSGSLFQFGAAATSSSSGFPSNQQFSFSVGKQTKRSFGGLANNEPDNKKAAGTFTFGGTNTSKNQGLSFGTSTASSFQAPSVPSTFTFGQQNQSQQPFQFGSQPQGSGVFAFGQSNQQQSTFTFNQQTTTMPFNQPTQDGSLNFSQVPTFNFTAGSNNPVFSAQNTTPIPGRTYKKATRRMRK